MIWTVGIGMGESFRPFQHLNSGSEPAVIYCISKRNVTSTSELPPSVNINYNRGPIPTYVECFFHFPAECTGHYKVRAQTESSFIDLTLYKLATAGWVNAFLLLSASVSAALLSHCTQQNPQPQSN